MARFSKRFKKLRAKMPGRKVGAIKLPARYAKIARVGVGSRFLGDMTPINQQAARQAVEWFRRHEPFIYLVAEKMHNMQAGMGAFDWGGMFSNIANTVVNAAPDIYAAKQQKEIMDMQLKRAAQGLPPADISQYTPVYRIEPSITPETEAAAQRMAYNVMNQTANNLKWPLMIGGGLLTVFLFRKKLGL